MNSLSLTFVVAVYQLHFGRVGEVPGSPKWWNICFDLIEFIEVNISIDTKTRLVFNIIPQPATEEETPQPVSGCQAKPTS